MGTVIAAIFLIVVLIFAYALCKSSGTKEDVDQKAIEYLNMQADGHNAEFEKKHTEDKE